MNRWWLSDPLSLTTVEKRRREWNHPMQPGIRGQGLENTGLFLQPAHVLYDLIDVVRLDGVDLRHVAELPMMRLDPIGRSPLKGRIAMMIGFIDFVHKRRALSGSNTSGPMTG